VLEYQACSGRLGIEVSKAVAAIQTEAHDEETIVAQVGGDVGECRSFGARCEVRHHVAGAHCGVKRLRLTLRGQRLSRTARLTRAEFRILCGSPRVRAELRVATEG